MFRPRTVLRLLFYFGLSWLVLAVLYVGLPNYTRIDNGIDYATKVLSSGGKLTRVYADDEYFSSNDAAEIPANNERRRYVALTFRIDKTSNSLIICDTGRASLARPTELTPVQEQEIKNGGFFNSETPIVVPAPAGDTDGINLPWFETADSVLMFNLIHRDQALVKLQVSYGSNGQKLNVWAGVDGRNKQPLLSLTLDSSENPSALISSASVPPLSSSPSPSYPMRLAVLLILAPLTILVLGLYMGIVLVFYAILNLFVRLFWIIAFSLLVSWLYKGRPSADDFVRAVIDDVAGILRRGKAWFGRTLSRRESDVEQPPMKDEKVIAEDVKESVA